MTLFKLAIVALLRAQLSWKSAGESTQAFSEFAPLVRALADGR
jgi:hypothetical protein